MVLNRDKHTKRPATQLGCLPSLLGDGDKVVEIMYGEGKNILYRADATREAKAEQRSYVPARQAQLTDQGRTPLNFESPFTPVSTVSRGHLSLVSLVVNSGFIRYLKLS